MVGYLTDHSTHCACLYESRLLQEECIETGSETRVEVQAFSIVQYTAQTFQHMYLLLAPQKLWFRARRYKVSLFFITSIVMKTKWQW